ncbi:unnamed protein product [Malus baccata var. baccata]
MTNKSCFHPCRQSHWLSSCFRQLQLLYVDVRFPGNEFKVAVFLAARAIRKPPSSNHQLKLDGRPVSLCYWLGYNEEELRGRDSWDWDSKGLRDSASNERTSCAQRMEAEKSRKVAVL